MGALDIRMASQSVRELGTPRMPDLRDGSVEAWQAQARAAEKVMDATARMGQATVENIAKRGKAVSDALLGLGGTAMKAADIIAEIAHREDERAVDDAVTKKLAWQQTEEYGDGKDVASIFSQPIENPSSWLEASIKRSKDQDGILKKELSPRQQKMYDQRIMRQNAMWAGKLQAHSGRVTIELQVTSAEKQVGVTKSIAAASFVNLDRKENVAKVNDYFVANERLLNAKVIPESKRAEARHKAAFELMTAAEEAKFAAWHEQMADVDDPDKARKAYDEFLSDIKARGDQAASANDQISQMLGEGGLRTEEKALLMDRLLKERDYAIAHAAQVWRQNAASVGSDYDKKEREFSDNTDESTWAPTLEEWSKDERLKRYDPKRAAQFGAWAADLRACRYGKGVKYKPNTEQLTSDIEHALIQLEILQNPDPSDPTSLTPDERAKRVSALQAGIAQNLRMGIANNALEPKQYETLHGRLRRNLNDQQKAAMRKLYSAFGVNTASIQLGTRGELSKADRDNLELSYLNYYAPDSENRQESRTRISGGELLRLGDALLGQMDAMGESINREGAIDKVINTMKSRWYETNDINKNIDLAVGVLIDMQTKKSER